MKFLHHAVSRLTPAVLVGLVPAVVAGALLFGGSSPSPRPVPVSATTWLASAQGALVRANGLVHRPAEQIVQRSPFPAARSGVRVVAQTPSAIFVRAADGRGPVSRVDVGTGRSSSLAADETVVAAGTDVYRMGGGRVVRLLPDGQPAEAGTVMGAYAGAASDGRRLYVATTDGRLHRIGRSGARVIGLPIGRPLVLAPLADGVAAYDPGSGRVVVVHDGSVSVEGRLPAGADALGASPDGGTFAVVTVFAGGAGLGLLTDGEASSRAVGFRPDSGAAPVIAGRTVYLADGTTGVVHGVDLGGGPERVLDFHDRGRAVFDVHRGGGFGWFDDVHGPYAYAIHGSTAEQIEKYAVRPTPTPAPSSSAPPPTEPPTSAPPTETKPPTDSPPSPHTDPPSSSHHASPSTSPSPSRSPSPGASPSRSPSPSHSASPSPSADPRERCDGDDASLSVDNASATGQHPRIHVRVCVAAEGATRYWIVSRAGGNWFAKKEIDGDTGRATYTVDLLNGSGVPGAHRDFQVVAARTSEARSWLEQNLAADEAGTPFDRQDLPDGIDKISASVASTS